MQVYDIIILILVGWLTLRGMMKGMVSQLASIAGVIVSIWAAIRFGPVLEPIVQSTFKVQAPWEKVLGITLAFVGASVAVMFLHRVLANLISAIRMQKYDRLCGGLFGFLKGVLIGMILTFFAVMLSEQTRELATQSHSGNILVRLIQRTQSLLPEDVSTLIEANLEGFRKQLDSSTEKAEETISQVGILSKAVSNFKGAFESMKGIVSPQAKETTEPDAADTVPRLSDNNMISANSSASLRDYTPPAATTLHYPAASAPVVDNPSVNISSTTSSPAPATMLASGSLGPPPTTGSLSAPPTVTIVAPSADLLPITSPATTPTLPNGETDWRILLRNMR